MTDGAEACQKIRLVKYNYSHFKHLKVVFIQKYRTFIYPKKLTYITTLQFEICYMDYYRKHAVAGILNRISMEILSDLYNRMKNRERISEN